MGKATECLRNIRQPSYDLNMMNRLNMIVMTIMHTMANSNKKNNDDN